MATRTYTKIADPINATALAAKILADTGKTVAVLVTNSAIEVTGSLTSGDDTAVQAAINSYVYSTSPGDAMAFLRQPQLDDGSLSTNSSAKVPTQHAVKAAMDTMTSSMNGKTANRTYVNGVAQNGTAQTGDLVEWIVTLATASGTVTDYVTTEGATRTSGGTALLSSIFPDSIQTNFIDSTGVYAQGAPTVTSNKTVSIPFTKQGFNGVSVVGINVLGTAAMNAIPNGVTVKVRLVGVAA